MNNSDYILHIINRIIRRSIANHNGCIEYPKVKHPYGLVSITMDGIRKSVPAHRAIYMCHNNTLTLPPNIIIRHTCDNPRCVNIDHLKPGSSVDNMRDCINRNRRAKKHNYHHRHRVHDDKKIKAIRATKGSVSYVAAKFNVSISYVSKLRNNRLKK